MAGNRAPEILIAGGGIGGLSAALALALKGRRVRVLEKAAEFGEIGYGIQMGPNVSRVRQALGVRDAPEPKAGFPDTRVMMDSVSGEEVTRISLGDAFVKRFGYRYFVIHRGDLHGTLFDACRRKHTADLDRRQQLGQ